MLAPASLAAQRDDRGRERDQARDTSFAMSRDALVDITITSGKLLVRGSDRTVAELRAGDARYELRTSGAGIALSLGELRGRGSRDHDMELVLPRGVRLAISGSTGDIDVRDVGGDVTVRVRSGDVHLAGVGERVVVESFSGDVVLEGGVGVARVESASGDITLQGVRGSATITTTSGDLTVGAAGAAQLSAQTVSGDITVDGTLADDARVRLDTHSGDVVLRVNDGLRGTLDFQTFSGELVTTSPVVMTPRTGLTAAGRNRPAQRFEFNGGGSASLTVTTFNGDLRFVRGARR